MPVDIVPRSCSTVSNAAIPNLSRYRRAIAAARAFGFHRVELTVREDNANALAVYKKVGCAAEGVQRHAVQVDSVYEDLILMAVLF
jgi:RimJ/RimL family protein N-acetyltransferase